MDPDTGQRRPALQETASDLKDDSRCLSSENEDGTERILSKSCINLQQDSSSPKSILSQPHSSHPIQSDHSKSVKIRTELNQVKFIEPRHDDIYGFHKTIGAPPNIIKKVSAETDKIEDRFFYLYGNTDACKKSLLHEKLFTAECTTKILQKSLAHHILEETKMKLQILRLQHMLSKETNDSREAHRTNPSQSLDTYSMLKAIFETKLALQVSLKEAKMKKYYRVVQEELDFWRSSYYDLDDFVNGSDF
jgi:hypothetical protein